MKRWLVLLLCAALGAQAQQRLSGREFMSPATQALQDDDAQNPAFLWVKQGQQRFEAACARCHSRAAVAGCTPGLADTLRWRSARRWP